MTEEFANNLIYLRGLNDLTQQELGDAVGVSPSQISRYEAGAAKPRKTVMAKLAAVLGVSPPEDLEKPMSRDHFPDTSRRDDDVELLFEVTFKKLGPIRCSLHFTRDQHKKIAQDYASMTETERNQYLGDFMVKAMVGAAETDGTLALLGDPEDAITNASARFFAPKEYLDEIRDTPLHDAFVSSEEPEK